MKNINIILCIDSNFILGAGTLIVSLLKNHNNSFFTFYVYTLKNEQNFISDQLIQRINKSNFNNYEIKFVDFEHIYRFDELQKNVNKRELMCVGRLLAVEDCPLPSNEDRVLYIDADMLCVRPGIDQLYDIDLRSKILAAYPSFDDHTLKPYNIERKNYFCAGILLINLKEWKKKDIGYKSMQFVIDKHPVLSDQDALNVTCGDNIVFLPSKYAEEFLRDETVIIHFAGVKPWVPWGFSKDIASTNEFRRYCKIFEPNVTKWISFKKDKFALVNFNVSSARYATKWISKKFFKKGNLKAAIYFYWQHLVIKVKAKGIIGILLLKSNTKA